MSDENKIALFVDLDNVNLDVNQFNSIRYQLNDLGSIVYAKLYGASERRHKLIMDVASANGYDMMPPLRLKRRTGKVVDHRIPIDIMDIIAQNSGISSVAVICASGDMVHLYSKLKFYSIHIFALGNVDEYSLAFVDKVLTLGSEEDTYDGAASLKSMPVVEEVQKKKPEKKPASAHSKTHNTEDDNNASDLAVIRKISKPQSITTKEEDELLAQVKSLLDEFNED